MQNDFKDLKARLQEIFDLRRAAAVLEWDQMKAQSSL